MKVWIVVKLPKGKRVRYTVAPSEFAALLDELQKAGIRRESCEILQPRTELHVMRDDEIDQLYRRGDLY